MAESKGALLAKSVQKHAGRAKEKILQNLGKVDRTADEIFDEHLQNFTRQQNAANRLQKEFNNYIRCIRAVQTASKTLMDSLNEVYESNWVGHDLLYVQGQNIEMLWQDMTHKLGDQVLIPLNTYQSQFPEMRKKIDKRGRKLVDYDSQRHTVQALQSNPKKRDEAKLAKAREALEDARRTYESLNSELHDELPALYDSRVLFLVTNLQTLFATEQVFHAETSKVFTELEAIVDKLATDCQRGSYTLKKNAGVTGSQSPKGITANSSKISPSSTLASPTKIAPLNDPSTTPPPPPASPPPTTTTPINNNNLSFTSVPLQQLDLQQDLQQQQQLSEASSTTSPLAAATASMPATTTTTTSIITTTTLPTSTTNTTTSITSTTIGNDSTVSQSIPMNPQVNGNGNNNNNNNNNAKPMEELYDIPAGATTDNLPPGVLYRVKATYKYTREDMDELSFEVGEIIRVVEYDDPEEQEEGWLMGVKEGTGEKGMFPANFTRPL